MNKDQQFFHDHAGFAWDPKKETPEEGRERGAEALAAAEERARDEGYSFQWTADPDITSASFSPSRPSWALWCCLARDGSGKVVGSLGGIDFGRHKEPWGDPYKRVIEAELAHEALPEMAVPA